MGDRAEQSGGRDGGRSPGLARRALFSLVVLALFFGLLELLLWAAGVDPLLSERDPFAGFSEQVRVYERDESRGVYRTVPRATRHSFNPQEFLVEKPPNGFRVFVIGGSSAYGFPWGARVAFARALGDALQASRPEREVEVVNAAAMSYGSHRLRILTRELLAYDPDLLIVYSGHNEFVERRFYREMLERPEELDRLRKLLYRWRLFSLLSRTRERIGRDGNGGVASEAGEDGAGRLLGLDVSREYSVNVGESEVAEVRALFEENLRAILDMADRAGVPVLLCTVPSNLRGWVPNQSLFDSRTTFEQQQELLALLAESGEALERGDAVSAVAGLERASNLAPGHAETWYRLGQAYEAVGRYDEARAAYVRARDLDAQPARAVSALNDTLRALAAERSSPFLDAERVFERASPHGLIGFNLIEDYVHPKPEGHRLLALELWKLVEESGLAGEPRPADPRRFDEVVGGLDPGDPGADPDAPEAAAGAETPSLLFNLAVVLENQGRFDQAMEKYRACLDLDPTHAVARSNLGRLLNRQGRFAEASREFSLALRANPGHVPAMVGLGEALRMQGRLAEALEQFSRATATDPGSAPAWNRLGVALSQQKRYAEAEAALRKGVELDPRNAEHQVDLGYTLLFVGKYDAAGSAFRAGLDLRADDARARNGLAAVLTEKGRLDEAERLFNQSLQADPRDPFARQGLAEIERRRAAGP